MASQAKNKFEIPTWAAKPPPGLHLDVLKDGKMIQKLMIDEKKCYFFGRNRDLCDFAIDHASCSRVHAALVWHKDLQRPFLIDLSSTHGTYVGHIRLDPQKPQQLFVDKEFHFGASTRIYIVRERPLPKTFYDESVQNDEDRKVTLPVSEIELDNLTEFNTAHNRRIAQIVSISDVSSGAKKNSSSKSVSFSEEDEIINPEDTDPSIGKFRNLVQSTLVLNNKKRKNEIQVSKDFEKRKKESIPSVNYKHFNDHHNEALALSQYSVASKLGIALPNLAPDLNYFDSSTLESFRFPEKIFFSNTESDITEKPKKKYVKEAWPGKKPGLYV